MTQDPFAALGGGAAGGGGLDLNALMQQAQQMQEQLEQAQARLADARVEGTVSGGAVTGVAELVGVEIRAGGFDGSDPDDLADLGDMIVAAYRDAKGQADGLASDALGPLAGGGGGMPGIPGLGG
jgi:DNA-binding protein YbaB